MRRLPPSLVGAVAGVFVTLAALGPASAAFAEDATPTPTGSAAGSDASSNVGPSNPGQAVCTVSSSSLNEVTGMVATDKGIYAVESGDTADPSVVTIWTINAKTCAATSKTYGFNPVDPQDLALGSDGALWIADIGDGVTGHDNGRERVAVEKVVIGSSKAAVPYRILYPTTGKFDAQAMILDKDDSPIIISSEGGKGVLYKPSKAIVADATTNLPTLKKVGEFTPLETGTSNPQSQIGNAMVTGAAKSPDGSKVVIRTASDAYEFTVGDDGDIVKAITTTDPVVTPLPDEPAGKAITYSADGKSFLTLSEASKSKLLSYTPYVPTAADPGANPSNNAPTSPKEQSWLSKLTLSQLTRIVAAVGVVGLVLAISGIIGIRRARRRRREEEEDYDYDDYDDEPRRGRRGGRGRDDHGYGLRGPEYADQYGGYGDAGYGANGYGSNGYGGGGYAEAGYGGGQYGADQYGQGGGGYGADQYGQGGGYDYGQGQNYGGAAAPQQYGGYDYGAGQQGADYGQPGGYGGGQYGGGGGGYGYEDDFDPMQDPRRR
jgi:hypothetical protein